MIDNGVGLCLACANARSAVQTYLSLALPGAHDCNLCSVPRALTPEHACRCLTGSGGPQVGVKNGGRRRVQLGERGRSNLAAIRTQPGTGAFIDRSPSKEACRKGTSASSIPHRCRPTPLYERKRAICYEDVVDKSSSSLRSFARRFVCEAAPSAPEVRLPGPLHNNLFRVCSLAEQACMGEEYGVRIGCSRAYAFLLCRRVCGCTG
jgi:hypothetical protein